MDHLTEMFVTSLKTSSENLSEYIKHEEKFNYAGVVSKADVRITLKDIENSIASYQKSAEAEALLKRIENSRKYLNKHGFIYLTLGVTLQLYALNNELKVYIQSLKSLDSD